MLMSVSTSHFTQFCFPGKGIAGDHLGWIAENVGPLELRSVKVRDALNAIVRSGQNLGWVAMVAPQNLGNWQDRELWKIVDYGNDLPLSRLFRGQPIGLGLIHP